MKKLIFLFLFGYIIFGCKENPLDQLGEITTNSYESQLSDFANDSIYFEIKNNIDSDSSLFQASSLEYLNNEGSNFHAEALIDENKNIRKLSSTIIDSIHEVINEFYYVSGKKRIAKKLISFFQRDSNYFQQYISFFDTSGKELYSGIKSFEDLSISDLIPYQQTDSLVDMNEQTAKQIIQQQGNFKTNFRGFAFLEAYKLEFLKLGSNDGNFSSLLAISDDIPGILNLKKNEETFKGKPIRVEFTKIKREDGFSYQLLLNVSLNP